MASPTHEVADTSKNHTLSPLEELQRRHMTWRLFTSSANSEWSSSAVFSVAGILTVELCLGKAVS